MTTKLADADTKFLPFNQSSNGAGKIGGAGNPSTTAYLWREILCKDTLLELLQKYLLIDDERIIFPRYHQPDAVTKLLAHVRSHGTGRNYLIQHSAGYGKSNSIAWLAHRLAGLHDAADEKIFNSVLVVTDRRVLDRQLQDTVAQFEQVPGLVVKVNTSAELRDALNCGKKIIVTTLQKFPVIFREIRAANKKFAVIVNEAHSSQTGSAAHKLKPSLTDTQKVLAEEDFLTEDDRAYVDGLKCHFDNYAESAAANKKFAVIVNEAHSSQTGSAAGKLKRSLTDTQKVLAEETFLIEHDRAYVDGLKCHFDNYAEFAAEYMSRKSPPEEVNDSFAKVKNLVDAQIRPMTTLARAVYVETNFSDAQDELLAEIAAHAGNFRYTNEVGRPRAVPHLLHVPGD